MSNRVRCFLAIMLLVCGPAAAATITVERDGTGDFMVLQEALNAAADGDTIRLGPGDFTEMPWTRLPGYSWDVRSCGRVPADDVTIIGAGPELTRIGPAAFAANGNLVSPKAITYTGRGRLCLLNLTVRNCYDGAFIQGTLEMENCVVENNIIGVFWIASGSGGRISDTTIRGATPGLGPIALHLSPDGGGGAGVLIERCDVRGGDTIIDTPGVTVIDCSFSDSRPGISVSGNGSVALHRCSVDVSMVGVIFSLGGAATCEINDSDIAGGYAALHGGGVDAPYGRFVVRGSRLRGGSAAVVDGGYRPRAFLINNCDIYKGSGPVFRCTSTNNAVTHDLRNNYWGTTSEADIQSWIIDHNDDPTIPATVLYLPFVGMPVPTESTSWGDLKALFR